MTALGSVADVTAVVARRLSLTVRAEQERTGASVPPARRRELAEELIEAEVRIRLSTVQQADAQSAIEEAVALERAVTDALCAMGGLQPYLDMPDVENINATGHDQVFLRFADGRRERGATPVADSDADLIDLIRTAAARVGHEERRFDRGAPMLSLQLPDGSRLFAVMAVTKRPSISIRRHRYPKATLSDLIALGTVGSNLAAFLSAAVRARLNILIAGGTGAGKTTMLRALAAEMDPAERLVTIEDALELGLDTDPDRHWDVVAIQAREANSEGRGAISQAELVRAGLRMSPDRVIVGEIRGAEVIPMCNAMSQGNDGSMATLHASTSAGVFAKLAAYAAQSPERLDLASTNLLVANALHLVVQLDQAPDGTRVVSSVREITGADGPLICSNEIFRPGPDRRAVPTTPPSAVRMAQLEAAGFVPEQFRRPR
ncbi:CpaF family protein [Catenulispora subtropica]|uniref:ATPase, T2SS/T4P/T4SS family n=1 Tax=Catenulispora subtropica TaxID=450798 RepID=A0ABN2SPZ5_9ACTN